MEAVEELAKMARRRPEELKEKKEKGFKIMTLCGQSLRKDYIDIIILEAVQAKAWSLIWSLLEFPGVSRRVNCGLREW